MNPARKWLLGLGAALIIGAAIGYSTHNPVWGTLAVAAFVNVALRRTRLFMPVIFVWMVGIGIVGAFAVFSPDSWISHKVRRTAGFLGDDLPSPPATCSYDSLKPPVVQLAALTEPEDFGYPAEAIDRMSIRQWLIQLDFDELDTMLTAYADSARRDYRLEYRAADVYEAFSVADTTLKHLLDRWVGERPRSGNARLIRGGYYLAIAWRARYASSVRNEDAGDVPSVMDANRHARDDLDEGLRLTPCNVMGYYMMMRIAPLNGNIKMSRTLMDAALTMQPYSFLVRARHVSNVRPTWGGSYVQMDGIAAEADWWADVNPRLTALHGLVAMDRGQVRAQQHDSAGALARYDSSLAFGDFWQFRQQRGELYYQLGKYPEAAEDFDHALVQRPQDPDLLRFRAAIWYAIGRVLREDRSPYYREVYRLTKLAAQIDPSDPNVKKSLAFYRANIGKYESPESP